MNKFLGTIRERLSRVRKVWIITAQVVLGLVFGLASFTSGAVAGKTAVAATNTQAVVTPTTTPTTVPGNNLPTAGTDVDALFKQMEAMTQSLQGVMGQLDQKSANLNTLPAATPTPAIDTQAVMNEMQAINQEMGPLMLRIQADLQGTPSAEELANVRAQVVQINERIGNLLTQLQAARGAAAPGMAVAPIMPAMSGMGHQQPTAGGQYDQSQDTMARLDQMTQQMEYLLHQMQSGNMAGQTGSMSGMSSSSPSRDNVMSMMDNMMGMDSMNMATPTTTPGMSSSDPSTKTMDDMMMMMDNMMAMMDKMMNMHMASMPDM